MPTCTISLQECFMDGESRLTRATDVFTNIAFRQPKCGDCGAYLMQTSCRALG